MSDEHRVAMTLTKREVTKLFSLLGEADAMAVINYQFKDAEQIERITRAIEAEGESEDADELSEDDE